MIQEPLTPAAKSKPRRHLAVAAVLLIAASAIAFWWRYPRLGRVEGVDRAVVTRLPFRGNIERQWVVTESQNVQSLKEAVLGSVRIMVENKCEPPEYQIELYRGEELILSVCPSPCCAIFHAEGAIYQDREGRFRTAVATVAVE